MVFDVIADKDLPSSLNSTCRIFVDDCLLYRKIDSITDANILQQHLFLLEKWAGTWMMQFNSLKCVELTVSKKLSPLTVSYKFCNDALTHVTEAKYLNLTLDQHLSFNKHIDIICKKQMPLCLSSDAILISVVTVLNLMLTKLTSYQL